MGSLACPPVIPSYNLYAPADSQFAPLDAHASFSDLLLKRAHNLLSNTIYIHFKHNNTKKQLKSSPKRVFFV